MDGGRELPPFHFFRRNKVVKRFLMIIGLLAFATGLLWLGQGLGYIRWPESSFMISQVNWAYYGAGLAGVGAILVAFAYFKK
jgi:uncharacterized membrane protein